MKKKITVLLIIVCLGSLVLGIGYYGYKKYFSGSMIKVGILHSLTGTLGNSEKHLVNAVLMAIDEINQQGGVLGQLIKPIIVDGKSDEAVFEQGAKDLIYKEKVAVIFGCWTSSSRKRVKTVVEKANNLLMYPVQYEGLETSKNVIYTGAAPNQAIIPAVTWAFQNIGKRFFIVGSDYIFPRAAAEIIALQAASLGAEIVGQEFIPLGSDDVHEVIKAIQDAKPAVIFNTINGSSNNAFFKELRSAGITAEKVPVVSFSIAEPELAELHSDLMVNNYAVWNYFQSIDRDQNRLFIEQFKAKFGHQAVTSNNIESAYDNVYLWAQAVNQAKTVAIDTLLPILKKQVFDGPGTIIYLDENNHAWREVFIGKIRFDKQFAIVWRSKKNVHPEPYPIFQDQKTWQAFLEKFYEAWGKQWAKPT